MNRNGAIRMAQKVFSNKSNVTKAEVIKKMQNVDTNSSYEEKEKAAKLFRDNFRLFTGDEIVIYSKEFVERTGYKPR